MFFRTLTHLLLITATALAPAAAQMPDCGGNRQVPCPGPACDDFNGARQGVNGNGVCAPCGAMGRARCLSALLHPRPFPIVDAVAAVYLPLYSKERSDNHTQHPEACFSGPAGATQFASYS